MPKYKRAVPIENGIFLWTEDYHEDVDVTAVLSAYTGKKWTWNEVGLDPERRLYTIFLCPGECPKNILEYLQLEETLL